jgi:hypothetical protein
MNNKILKKALFFSKMEVYAMLKYSVAAIQILSGFILLQIQGFSCILKGNNEQRRKSLYTKRLPE